MMVPRNGHRSREFQPVVSMGFLSFFRRDDSLVVDRAPVNDGALAERVRRIRCDAGLRERVLDAVDLSRDRFEEPEYPEQQLYSSGFISTRDMIVSERFHQAAPQMRVHFARTFGDYA
jgi:Exonuclease C-terminal